MIILKKLITLLSIALLLTLTACNSQSNSNVENAETNVEISQEDASYKIGILQFAEHPSLDSAREGFKEMLKENGISAEYIELNSQSDVANSQTMAQKLISDEVDLIYAVSTISAQSARQVTSDIPIVFSSVTDPAKSGLVEEGITNITGVSDKTPIEFQMPIFHKLDENIQKVGIVYSTSETNSLVQIEDAKEAAKKENIEIIEVGISNVNDMPQAIDAMLGKVDAVLGITDNLVANSLDLLTSKVNLAKKPLVLTFVDTSSSGKNVLISSGFSYYDHGKQAGSKAIDILINGVKPSDIPIETTENITNYVSIPVAEQIGIDVNLPIIKESIPVE